MATETDILNVALIELGQPEATGSGDTASWVRRVRNRLPRVARDILSDYPWNCATVRVLLTQDGETPIGARFRYEIPAKRLRLNWLNNTGESPDISGKDPWWSEEAGFVLCNFEPCYAGMISTDFLTAYGAWPEKLVKAVGFEVAARSTEVTTKKESKRDSTALLALRALREARVWDANQRGRRQLPHGSWLMSRLGYTSRDSRRGYDIE